MREFFLFLLLLLLFIESCSLKKEEVKIISKSKCDELAFKIKNSKPDDDKYKIAGIIRGKGLLYAIFRGYINSNSKISFYTPFGKKIYSIESLNKDILCIKSNKDLICADKNKVFKILLKIDLPNSLKLKDLILGNFDIADTNSYVCEDNKIIFINKDREYIYSTDGKIENLKFDRFLIKYNWENSKEYPTLIKIYENGKYKLKLKIKSLKKVK
ncbi:MAG: hypothetical protein DSY59_03790 [Persephonella sp.]|nr:MAG: hypothetical protein DSY60_02590 [Persephonella sp.]RUM59934.1 MAG: hypothetical protein DSY59_03790 [Persephonella sp.]